MGWSKTLGTDPGLLRKPSGQSRVLGIFEAVTIYKHSYSSFRPLRPIFLAGAFDGIFAALGKAARPGADEGVFDEGVATR